MEQLDIIPKDSEAWLPAQILKVAIVVWEKVQQYWNAWLTATSSCRTMASGILSKLQHV